MNRDQEDGAVATEYGLLIMLIAAVIVASMLIFGDFTGGMFTDSCDRMLTDGVSVGVPAAECN